MPEPRLSLQQKAAIKHRALDCCEYCWSQEAYSPDTFSVEHITPVAKGGTNDLNNLANACQGCNNRKFISTEAIDPSVVNCPHCIIHVAIVGQNILLGMKITSLLSD